MVACQGNSSLSKIQIHNSCLGAKFYSVVGILCRGPIKAALNMSPLPCYMHPKSTPAELRLRRYKRKDLFSGTTNTKLPKGVVILKSARFVHSITAGRSHSPWPLFPSRFLIQSLNFHGPLCNLGHTRRSLRSLCP